MNLPTKEQRIRFKVEIVLNVQRTLHEYLIPSSLGQFGETVSNSAELDREVRTSAEATFIRSCNRLDDLLDQLGDSKADEAVDASVQKLLDTQIESNREQAETSRALRRPSLALVPELARHPTTGQWVAFYGDLNSDACVIGIGDSPDEATRDFDKEYCTRQKAGKSAQLQGAPAPKKKAKH